MSHYVKVCNKQFIVEIKQQSVNDQNWTNEKSKLAKAFGPKYNTPKKL